MSKNPKQDALLQVRKNGYSLKNVSDELKDDREVVIEAMKQNPQALEYASVKMQERRDLMLNYVQRTRDIPTFAPDKFKSDQEFLVECIQLGVSESEFDRFVAESMKEDPGVLFTKFDCFGPVYMRFAEDLVERFGNSAEDYSYLYVRNLQRRRELIEEASKRYSCVDVSKDSVLPVVDLGADILSFVGFVLEKRPQFLGLVGTGMVVNLCGSTVLLISYKRDCLELFLNSITFGLSSFVLESIKCYREATKTDLLIWLKVSEGVESCFSFMVNSYALLIAGYLDDFPILEGFDLFTKWAAIGTSMVSLPLMARDSVKAWTIRNPKSWSPRWNDFVGTKAGHRVTFLYQFSDTASMLLLLLLQLAYRPYAIFIHFGLFAIPVAIGIISQQTNV